MASWGPKTFEDDTALDWISELVDSDDPRNFLIDSITTSGGDLDMEECAAVLAAAETIVAVLDEPRAGLPDELLDWVDENDCDDISDLPAMTLKSVKRVMGKDSELCQSWEEGEGYEDWKAEVEALYEILDSLSQV
ncbi:protein of unknown function [Rubritalea squalenifaciens DSM 18772]|uniref:DUF4259 domain-containing protein n=2 Tax=Rubritalea TaxID=361050 RepID=A0A1M6BJR2_9BACT|nr:DUF4259 domain-containing protein [Rubritalea squalenifaciens]SHI48828.1 protein of unknown function [Rubritalea squalenifaciens DSM 18772]